MKRKTGRLKRLTPQEERKLAHKLKKGNGGIAKAQNQAELKHVSKQTVCNYIIKSKKFIFKKPKHHPKWEKKPY